MDMNDFDLDAVLDRDLNIREIGWVTATSNHSHRFLRANGLLADGSFCFTCHVSSTKYFNLQSNNRHYEL